MRLIAYELYGRDLHTIRGLRPVNPEPDSHADYAFVQVVEGQAKQLFRKSEVLFSVATDKDLANPDVETYEPAFIFQLGVQS